MMRRRNIRKELFGSPGDLHVSTSLTNVAIDYVANRAAFVAGKIFPRVNVDKQSNRYWIFDRDNRDDFEKRAPATESSGLTMALSSDTYFAEKWALHYDVADEDYANADALIDIDRRVTNRLMNKGLLKQEKIFIAQWFDTQKWASESGGVTGSPSASQFVQWSDAASNPIEDIRAKATAVQLTTGGYRPNKLVLGQIVYDVLVNHPDIVDRIKYSSTPDSPAIVSRRALAQLFEVEEIYVLNAVEDTAKENIAGTRTNAFVGGKHALLLYSPSAPSTMEPSAGYTFMWTGLMGNAPEGIRVKKFRMEELEAERIEAEMAFDMKQTASDLGHFFYQAVV